MTKEQFISETFSCLQTQLERYPGARAEDIVKCVFQGLLGVGHLLASPEQVETYIVRETAGLSPAPDEPLLEPVSPAWARLNLRRAMAEGLIPHLITKLMMSDFEAPNFSREDVRQVCVDYTECIGCSDMADALARIGDEHWLPSHSETYRQLYHPAYRLIPAQCAPLLPILCAFAKRDPANARTLVTIDGPCASGKTTLASQLANILDAAVAHTDDFVVPHAKKTPERLAQPGGNCDWERLVSEVIAPWKTGQTGTYRRYDCHQDSLTLPEPLPTGNILILEGSYCNLPAIRTYADVRVFVNTPEFIRWERLKARESPASLKLFEERWIPLENAYFEAYGLPDGECECVILF